MLDLSDFSVKYMILPTLSRPCLGEKTFSISASKVQPIETSPFDWIEPHRPQRGVPVPARRATSHPYSVVKLAIATS